MQGAPWCAGETQIFTTIWCRSFQFLNRFWSVPSDRATATHPSRSARSRVSATVIGIDFSLSPQIERKGQYLTNTPQPLILVCPIFSISASHPNRRVSHPLSVLAARRLTPFFIDWPYSHYSMSRPTNSHCALPTVVGYAAADEEPRPSPGWLRNTRPQPIAEDGEGGIPFVQRLVAEDDPARTGEGESLSFVSLHPSIPVVIYTYHLSDTYGSSTTHQSSAAIH